MTEQICRHCRYYYPSRGNKRTGSCRASPPFPIMVGMQQVSVPVVPHLRAVNGQMQAQPIVNGFFPPVTDTVSCGVWTPKVAEPEYSEDTAQPEPPAEAVDLPETAEASDA